MIIEGYDGPQPDRAGALHTTAPVQKAALLRRLRRKAESMSCRNRLPRLYGTGEVRNMSDMRLIVAGAGGRMGRALTRVISETQGAVLAGALEAPGSELLGKDAGVLAGLPANGVELSADLWSMSANADGILDFTVPGATIANVAIAAAARPGSRHRHHRAVGVGRRRDQERHLARHRREVGQYEPRRQSAGGAGEARGAIARREFRHRNPGNAPPRQDRRAVGHRADARRGRRRRPQDRARAAFGARPRRRHRRAPDRRYRLCVVARRHRHRRSQRDLRRPHGAHRADAPRRGPHACSRKARVKAALWARGKKPGLYSMADVLGLGDF